MKLTIGLDIWYDKRLSRIAELQAEITRALIYGHKATANDEFAQKREEINQLRKELGLG